MLRMFFTCLGLALVLHPVQAQQKKMNVLFVAVDDLKPNIGAFGDSFAKTPNLDKLAANGTAFTRAYCQQAVCSPSRSSVMTGCRPDTTKVYDLVTHFRTAMPNAVTVTQHFKNNGYYTQGIGKIYHGGYDDQPSWSVPWEGTKGAGHGPEGQALNRKLKMDAKGDNAAIDKIRGLPVEAPLVEDEVLNDGWTAKRAIEVLKERKDKSEPFFLAVGFAKPHLPFVAPKKYWDMYDSSKVPMPEVTAVPVGAPSFAPQFGGELRQYHGIPKTGAMSPERTRELIHGYYAAMSFMDAQFGKVYAALHELGLAENTVVILWGDHGWHLGDHNMWCKHTNYEQATRAPIVLSVPKQKTVGARCDRLVEFVDMYPTLVEACGLAMPGGLEGHSFLKLTDDPKATWKRAAFSQYPRGGGKQPMGALMGYAVRTEGYRYVAWKKKDTGEVIAQELYDMKNDPLETKNIADEPAMARQIEEHARVLKAGWKENTPPAK